MSRRLGVDLSSTRAALASVSETRRGLQLRGFALLDAEGDIGALAGELRQARRAHRFPRMAEVVAWPGDQRVDAVRQAGFRIERVITPGEALSRVARRHSQALLASGVTAVVCLHLKSGAVAVIRDGRPLFETQLGWSVAATLSAADSELLRRYTFISELTESLRRVFELVRTRQGADVIEILTCGSLGDLRSLTMPLAAEFDVEVETLDSTDDIEIRVRDATPQQMRDTIASLRLAIAAGKRWHKRSVADLARQLRVPRMSLVTRAAAVAALCVLAVFLWVRFNGTDTPRPPTTAARSAPQRPDVRGSVNPPPAANRPAAGPSAPARPVQVKPLAARPLPMRVNARLHAVPRGIPHAQLLLALARAEHAIPPPREAARVAAAAPTVPPRQPQPVPVPVPAATLSRPNARTGPAATTTPPRESPRVAAASPAAASPSAAPRVTPPATVPPAVATRIPAQAPPSAAPRGTPTATASAAVATRVPVKAPPSAPREAARNTAAAPAPAPSRDGARVTTSRPPATSPGESASVAAARPPLSPPPAVPPAPAGSANAAVERPSPDELVKPITPMARATAAPRADFAIERPQPRSTQPAMRLLPAPPDVVVTSILWSPDRQLAIVNSRIVGAGDLVGTHTIVEVQADAVVLRDRAGRLRRAGLRQGP